MYMKLLGKSLNDKCSNRFDLGNSFSKKLFGLQIQLENTMKSVKE